MNTGTSNKFYQSILETIGSSTSTLAFIHKALAKGFDLNHVKGGRSLLDAAVIHNDKEICQALVTTKKMSQNTLNKALTSAVSHYATQPNKKYTICQLLLKAGAKPEKDVIPDILFPILDDGLFEKGMKILVSLLRHGADVNVTECEHGYHLLTMASRIDIHEDETVTDDPIDRVFDLLLKYRINPEANTESGGITALMKLIESQDFNLVDSLIEYGADITMEDDSGRTTVDYTDNPELKDFLVKQLETLYGKEIATLVQAKTAFNTDKGKKLNTPIDEALHAAAIRQNTKEVARLLKKKANPDHREAAKMGGTPLLHRMLFGYFYRVKPIVTQLLDAGANVNIRCPTYGATPLHLADTLEAAEFLVDRGADVTLKNKLGRTVLHSAIGLSPGNDNPTDLLALLTFFLDQGVDPNEKTLRGLTALHQVSLLEGIDEDVQKAMIKLLSKYNADINAQDIYGKTPLHRAVQKANMTVILTLIEAGANPTIKCGLGKLSTHYPYVSAEIKKLLSDATNKFKKKRKERPNEESEVAPAKKRPRAAPRMFQPARALPVKEKEQQTPEVKPRTVKRIKR